MRCSIFVAGIVLLAGCSSNPPAPPPPPGMTGGGGVAVDPPLCTPTTSSGTVRIDLNSHGSTPDEKFNPKECSVAVGTWIVMREINNVAFKIKFPHGTPDEGKDQEFDSKPVGSYQEVKFKAKKVWFFKHTYEYELYVNGAKLDPTIIIDP